MKRYEIDIENKWVTCIDLDKNDYCIFKGKYQDMQATTHLCKIEGLENLIECDGWKRPDSCPLKKQPVIVSLEKEEL